MALFQYKALQNNGTIAEGQLEAGGRQEAFRQIESRGLRPIRVVEGRNGNPRTAEPAAGKAAKSAKPDEATKPAPSSGISFGNSNRISGRMLENFTRLLSSLLAAGVPLSRALVILTKEASTPAAAAQWKVIHDSVIDGMSLANSMA